MERVEIKQIADTLRPEQKTVIQAVGCYQDASSDEVGMLLKDLKSETGFGLVEKLIPILDTLREKNNKLVIVENDVGREYPQGPYGGNDENWRHVTGEAFTVRLTEKGRGFYKPPPQPKRPVKPVQEQLYVELNLAERILTIGTDLYRITSENEWDLLKTLASNSKIDRITPRMDGRRNRKNAVDTLRRRIGSENLHRLISFSSDGYFLGSSVKLSGGSQMGIRLTRPAQK